MSQRLRDIPSVEKVLQALGEQNLPRPLVLGVVRRYLQEIRSNETVPNASQILVELQAALKKARTSRLQPVINGTGIIVHTNLGRSPLAAKVAQKIAETGATYTNLEIDLESGERGGRAGYVEQVLALLCESEAAAVVNNCAAALVLILRHFARGKPEVIISRGELVQIGGGFRIPEILETSGAKLREVGTTNQTTLADYKAAIGAQTGLILKVHQSNFRMAGFVASPARAELSALARANGIGYVEDLGSGAMIETEKIPGLPHEPTPAEVLRDGAELVCFSGDKLFGGPQAGIIAGQRRLVRAMKADPFFRALRCDKLILSALQATAEICLAAPNPALPAVQMLNLSVKDLQARAEGLTHQLSGVAAQINIRPGQSETGGGALPDARIDSVVVEVKPRDKKLEELAAQLRTGTPPVLGYIAEGGFRIDLRTVFPEQDTLVVAALKAVLGDRAEIVSRREKVEVR